MMLAQRLSSTLKSHFGGTFNDFSQLARHKKGRFLWLMRNIEKSLPLLFGVALGIMVAVLIAKELWYIATATALLIPVTILFSRYPFGAIIIWLLLAPFVQVTATSEVRTVFWMVHRAMIPAALIMVWAKLVVKRSSTLKLGRVDFAMMLSMGLLLISVYANYESPMPMLYQVYDRFFVPFCAYWLIRYTTPGEEDLKRLLPILFVIVIAECVIANLAWFAPELLPSYWSKYEGARATGSLRGYSGYTIALVSYGLLLFHAALNHRSGLIRIAYLFAFGFATIGVFISFSRGSWLGGLVVALALLLIYPKATVRMTVIVLTVMVILANSVMADHVAWANQRLKAEDTALDRLVVYNTAWQMFKVRPFFGWGYETYDRYDRPFQSRVANHVSKDLTSHNTYLTVLVERGAIGFLIYYFPAFWLLLLTFRVWSRVPNHGFWSRKLLLILWLMILFEVVVGNFTDTKRLTFVFTMWWITLGLIANMVQGFIRPGDVGPPAWTSGVSKRT
jgi:O-antigen ligase